MPELSSSGRADGTLSVDGQPVVPAAPPPVAADLPLLVGAAR